MALIKMEAIPIAQALLRKAIPLMNNALEQRKVYAEAISPVDSGDYISKHKVNRAQFWWLEVVGSNENDSEHAYGVEFGFRKTPVNWTDRDGSAIIANPSVGAKVMQRMTLQTKDKVTRFIAQSIR